MAYAGIDYSLGESNRDATTGIHYGVISSHSINLDCLDNVEYDYGTPTCPECGNDIGDSSDVEPDAKWNTGKDYACAECEMVFWADRCFPDEALGWSYEADGYQLTDCLDSDIFVLKAPFFTYAQYCSPCVPGAGNLDTPVSKADGGAKTYCLGHDWFDGDSAPYPVYDVKTGSPIPAPAKKPTWWIRFRGRFYRQIHKEA